MILKKPDTLEQAIVIATRYDALCQALGKGTFERERHFVAERSVEDRFEDPVETGNDPMELGAVMINPKCWNCGKSGHKARDCPEPRKESKAREGPQRRPKPSQ